MLTSIFLAACQEEILHDLSERDANKVVRHLSAANLGASKVPQADGRWAIAVERDQMVSALSHLDTQRVLAIRSGSAQAGKSSMIPSREEQRFRHERALATAIEESLAAIPGVLEARVHINVPDEDPLFTSQGSRLGSGSVLLVVDESFGARDEEISALVAGAAGIARESVRVLKSSPPPTKVSKGESAAEVLAQRVEFRATSMMPWAAGGAFGGVLVLALGVKRVVGSRRRRSTFPLPKELDFEG